MKKSWCNRFMLYFILAFVALILIFGISGVMNMIIGILILLGIFVVISFLASVGKSRKANSTREYESSLRFRNHSDEFGNWTFVGEDEQENMYFIDVSTLYGDNQKEIIEREINEDKGVVDFKVLVKIIYSAFGSETREQYRYNNSIYKKRILNYDYPDLDFDFEIARYKFHIIIDGFDVFKNKLTGSIGLYVINSKLYGYDNDVMLSFEADTEGKKINYQNNGTIGENSVADFVVRKYVHF